AKKSMGGAAFVAVALMALGNAAGRVTAGVLSDKIGRRGTLLLVLVCQALLMLAAIPVTGASHAVPILTVVTATLIGFNYGANLSLFPSFTKDFWGLKSFGLNYGLLFTAWGVGGLVLSRWQQVLTTHSGGNFASAFTAASALLMLGALLAFFIKPPKT